MFCPILIYILKSIKLDLFTFIWQPFLPLSASRVEYDSEESQGSDEDEEDDFDPNSPLQEHSNNNSYRYADLLHAIYLQIMLCVVSM